MNGSPRLIRIPGLGADERLFRFQRDAFPWLEVPRWIEHQRGESLAGYAARMAVAVAPDDSRPLVLGGASMGGMIAQEMARHLPARAVILIGSCRDPGAITDRLRRLEHASRPLPNLVLHLGRPLAARLINRVERLPPAEAGLVVAMARETPMPWVRWAARAIFEWPGARDLPVPVHSIHGQRDSAIRCRIVKPDQAIPGGHHVISLSHPAQVNAFIGSCLDRVSAAVPQR